MSNDGMTREELFDGWKGCSNHGCVVTGPKKYIGTNSTCRCVVDARKSQLVILQARLQAHFNAVEDQS